MSAVTTVSTMTTVNGGFSKGERWTQRQIQRKVLSAETRISGKTKQVDGL